MSIKANGVAHTSAADFTWLPGENTIGIHSAFGTTELNTVITVTSNKTLAALTVTSAEGTVSGDTKITLTPALKAGCVYKYKTAASVTAPILDAVVDETWLAWDGVADITATTGHDIVIVEVTSSGATKAAGTKTVVSLT